MFAGSVPAAGGLRCRFFGRGGRFNPQCRAHFVHERLFVFVVDEVAVEQHFGTARVGVHRVQSVQRGRPVGDDDVHFPGVLAHLLMGAKRAQRKQRGAKDAR